MPFCPSKNFIFIHITKTAGSSFNDFFKKHLGEHDYLFNGSVNHEVNYFVGFAQNQAMEHLNIHQFYKILGKEKFNQCFKFSFIRNPFDRLVSTYHWNKINPFVSKDYQNYFKQCSFEQYVLEDKVQFPSPQHYWICDKNKKLLVNYIGRYENLIEDFKKICQQFSLPFDSLPHTYKTEREAYQDYYTPAIINKVQQFYKDDLELFDYKF